MTVDRKCRVFIQSVGSRIRALRAERGWTLEGTEEFGWDSWRELQKIEAGRNITLATLWKVAEFYEVAPSEILKGLGK